MSDHQPDGNQSERSTREWLEVGDRHNSPSYDPARLIVDHGEGVHLYDRDGEAYLDFAAGIAVNALGYNHPDVTEALHDQVPRCLHASNMFYTAEQIEFMETLCGRCFGDRVFVCNSGAEATEAGMKLAKRYQYAVRGDEDRTKIVAMQDSFHGRTMGAITATGQPKYHEGFHPLVPNYEYMPFNDVEAVPEWIDEETAGVILEPVQGEGGIRPARPEFLQAVRERCDEVGALLIFDEVQAGVGRTGSLFAYQGYEVTPDIMCLAKGLGGGTPLGAMVSTNEVYEGWKLGSHASTFGGNPLVCAAGKTVLEVIERDDLCENAHDRGRELREGLRDLADAHGMITDVRGRGLMCGAEVGDPAGDIVDHARQEHLLINTAGGDTLRFVPPLIISQGDVDDALNRLDRAFSAYKESTASRG